ncbi:hypothetical protein A3B18_00375 [Candidatus Giovannonibacteria bacterium RIFCSPLOWO2_01_FULL_46_13]|uniref:Uncharacterized protein n=1 Tax=Candidatus Giovannonibacteria bacterium RIFCSPLOWO2_01_FULL_46_13 TaxID=1798352 RepID=A0A1F5X4B5_9BACT|nr:MAG: hypothetical protein A3B18_00375 [Candidatus Giovannonibacteria bacterium RIFCSPLOWO2_01_FULL_46_13]
MKVLVNIIGLLLTLGSAITILKSFNSWRGVSREGLFFFVLGFAFFATGFIWKIFAPASSYDTDLIFFSLGAAFMLLGARKVFSINPARN